MAIKITPDKKKHFYVGIPLGVFLQLIAFYFFPLDAIYAGLAAFFILVVICYGFELLSLVIRRGHADHLDAIAGILGGMIGMAIGWALNSLIN